MRTLLPVSALLITLITGCGTESKTATPVAESAVSKNSSSNEAPTVLEGLQTESTAIDKQSIEEDTLRPEDWFEDMTSRSGVSFTPGNGRESGRYFLLESFGAGVALVDFDLDGHVDLCLTGGGTFSRDPLSEEVWGSQSGLFRNRGNWQFSSIVDQAALSPPADYSLGCNATDVDNDGFQDLFIYCSGDSLLYRNMGDGTFASDSGQWELPATGMSTAAAWGDVDHDGFSDLFLANYADWSPAKDMECYSGLERVRDLCGPNQFDETHAVLWRNRGDGTFEDWSEKVGLKGGVKGLGLVAGDFDSNGLVDFYLANDEVANHLYLGQPNGTLREVGWESGVAAGEAGLEEGSMGTDASDLNGDGLPELWVVNFTNEDNSLHQNIQGGLFRHATVSFGLAGRSRMNVGWGTSLNDFDSDGWPDILVLNSNAVYSSPHAPFEQKSQLFRNIAGQRFEEVSSSAGTYFRTEHSARGCAVGDLDGDGAMDLVTSHLNQPARLLRNRKPAENWLRTAIVAVKGARHPIGATVTLAEQATPMQTRLIKSGAGYASESDPRLVFTLPTHVTRTSVIVQWPGGNRETFSGLQNRRDHVLIEGRGTVHEE